MKWLLIVAGVTIGLIVIMALAGACLPRNHRASRSADFRAPPGVLWAAITNVSAFPEWRAGITKVELIPNASVLRWREHGSHGTITYEQLQADPPNRLVTRIADPNLPFGGTWTFQLSAMDTGSSLTITENGEIRNVLFRFLSRFVFGYHSSIDSYLNSLGKKIGEPVATKSII